MSRYVDHRCVVLACCVRYLHKKRHSSSILSNLKKKKKHATKYQLYSARRRASPGVCVGSHTADSYNTGCSTVECKGLVPRVGSDFREPRAASPSIFLFRIRSTSLFKVFGGLASTSEYPVALEDSSNQWLVLESI